MSSESPNGRPASPRHVAHDSGLEVSSKSESSRIKELEEENEMLAEKATAAAHRFADYENDIRVLEAKLRQFQRTATDKSIDSTTSAVSSTPSVSRFGSFMQRKPLPNLPANGFATTPTARERELETALAKEQTARIEAEKKVKESSTEIEELSTTLFQQANDMVAAERKESALLKDRFAALEKSSGNALNAMRKENARLRQKLQTFEERDVDRRRRLEMLEAANKRVDRVKTLLLPP